MTDVSAAGAEKSEFRLDIQALRGVAVLLVVLFHAEVPWVPGGSLGVDIFFVISGYLISGMIARSLDEGRFSFREFYYRRAKRLLPASYVVLFAVVLLSPLVLNSDVISDLYPQVLGAVTFTTNFVLMRQTDYFDVAAQSKPLLHFWSLAVEEQFYFVMPALLAFTPARWRVRVVLTILLISGLACAIALQLDSSFAFYMLPTRAWQMAFGALAAVMPLRPRWLPYLRIPAFVAIVAVSVFPLAGNAPGLNSVIVILAAFIIIAGHDDSRWERSLPVTALGQIGNFSYSLYLVHWPIIVFTKAAWLDVAPPWTLWAAALVSVPVAWLLYHFIEEPTRRGFRSVPRQLSIGMAAAALAIGLAPMAVSAVTAGSTDFDSIRRNNYGLARQCSMGGRYKWSGSLAKACETTKAPKYLVLGDSYAMAWTSALMGPLKKAGIGQLTHGACDPLYGMARFPRIADDGPYNRAYAQECIQFYQDAVDFVAKSASIDTVIVAGRLSTIVSKSNLMLLEDGSEVDPSVGLAANGLVSLADRIRAAGKKVVVIAPAPNNGFDIGGCLERQAKRKVTFGLRLGCDISKSSYLDAQADTLELLAAAENRGVPVVNMADFFCDNEVCRTSLDGTFLYRDYGHLAIDGAKLIGERSDLVKRIDTLAR